MSKFRAIRFEFADYVSEDECDDRIAQIVGSFVEPYHPNIAPAFVSVREIKPFAPQVVSPSNVQQHLLHVLRHLQVMEPMRVYGMLEDERAGLSFEHNASRLRITWYREFHDASVLGGILSLDNAFTEFKDEYEVAKDIRLQLLSGSDYVLTPMRRYFSLRYPR